MSKDYHPIAAEEVIARFAPARQTKINLRAAQLIAEEIALSELRKAKRVTQEQIAKKIGGRQVYVSRFEKRADVKLSKLREYVEALGGELELLVTFPDSSAYSLARLGASSPSRNRRAATARKRATRRISAR
jgi:transcriptional regulator with XRE-family HTH domain